MPPRCHAACALRASHGHRLGRGCREPVRVEVGDEYLLQHVPVRRVLADARLEQARHLLGHRGDLLFPGSLGRHRDFVVDVRVPVLALTPERHRHQGRPGRRGKGSRARGHPGGLAEERHLDAARGQVAIARQADQAARPQPLCQHTEHALGTPGQRQDLHAQALAECDEPVE